MNCPPSSRKVDSLVFEHTRHARSDLAVGDDEQQEIVARL
jgi:hypothetical protein